MALLLLIGVVTRDTILSTVAEHLHLDLTADGVGAQRTDALPSAHSYAGLGGPPPPVRSASHPDNGTTQSLGSTAPLALAAAIGTTTATGARNLGPRIGRTAWTVFKWGRLATAVTPLGLGLFAVGLAVEALYFGYGQDDAGEFIDDAWTEEAESHATLPPPNIDDVLWTPRPEQGNEELREGYSQIEVPNASRGFAPTDLSELGIRPHVLHSEVAERSPYKPVLQELGDLARPEPTDPEWAAVERARANDLYADVKRFLDGHLSDRAWGPPRHGTRGDRPAPA